MAWRQFVMSLGALDSKIVEEIFERFGASSITLTDAGDDPILEPGPGETPLWTKTTITGMFSSSIDLQPLHDALLNELPLGELPTHHTMDLEDRVWEREWLKDFGPMRFGRRLWIHPRGYRTPDTDGAERLEHEAVLVHLDPGLAFGTGTHATTALCLQWLDGLSLDKKSLLDYGCGSGILAIAGLKLGCSSAVGMDIDPQAILATRQNAAANNVGEMLQAFASPAEITDRFDVVVANILAEPLVQFAESITLTLRGRGMLALSGVLCEQADGVMAAYEPWIDFDEPVFKEQGGQVWSRLTGKRRVG